MNESESFERIDPATLALFEGTLGAVWGLALALVTLIQVSAFGAVLSDSLLQGMLFGLGTTAVSLVVVPLLYFGIGAVLGFLHGMAFNAVMRAMGRVERPAEAPNANVAAASHTEDQTAEQAQAPAIPSDQPDYEVEPQYPEPVRRGARPAVTFGERIPDAHERGTAQPTVRPAARKIADAAAKPARPRRRL